MRTSAASGGCQQSAGDFLVHCHVAHHYFAGMWGLWRVYNTLQDGAASTDSLPPLVELPDREGEVEPAVDSSKLAGTTVDWSGKSFDITATGLARVGGAPASAARQAAGLRRLGAGLDDRRMDVYRERAGDRTRSGRAIASRAPGERPPSVTFDPETGKLAYPFLRPHFGKRPPFAPGHGPAPLPRPAEDARSGRRPPGANGPASVCPDGHEAEDV